MLEPRDFMVPVVDLDIPDAPLPSTSDWSNFEALIPRPSVSVSGMYMEMRGMPSAPIIRHVMRREAHERTVTQEEQMCLAGQMSRPKERYVPPAPPTSSSALNPHLRPSGFKIRDVPVKMPRKLPMKTLPPIGKESDNAPGEEEGHEPQHSPSKPEQRTQASANLSAMDRQAEGIQEVLWSEKKSSIPGSQKGSRVLGTDKPADADGWDSYYKQQRATMTAHKTFTWGGRYTYKGLDPDPQNKVNFQAGAPKRPLHLK